VSKLAAHRLVDVYRRRGLFVASGILFNHESPRRDPAMVTRKITLAAARWALGDQTKLKLGNLDVRRDWGFAGEYVIAMHAMLQLPRPRDFVIGTGESHSVADFLTQVFEELDGFDSERNLTDLLQKFIEVDPRFIRPNEIYNTRADPSRALRELNWHPTVTFRGLVKIMLRADIEALGSERHAKGARVAVGV
jgi:GDPmannose 4,6-dehydratase